MSSTLMTKLVPSMQETVEDETDLSDFISRSDAFDEKNAFPMHNTRVKALLEKRKCEEADLLANINEAYPLVHERLLETISDFLDYKRSNGSKIERAVYDKMDLVQFIDR